MSPKDPTQFNTCLARACQARNAACCKKGKLFLPEDERARMERWLQAHEPHELGHFRERTEGHGSFSLYDQRDRCQFLDGGNLCRLHNDGVKPSECFWWPFHVYVSGPGALEIRVSTYCCDAYKAHAPLPYVREIIEQMQKIGSDVIRRYRGVYAGSHANTVFIKKLEI